MLLSDDDWLEETYVERCLARCRRTLLAAWCAAARATSTATDRAPRRSRQPRRRRRRRARARYLRDVDENGLFYGLARTRPPCGPLRRCATCSATTGCWWPAMLVQGTRDDDRDDRDQPRARWHERRLREARGDTRAARGAGARAASGDRVRRRWPRSCGGAGVPRASWRRGPCGARARWPCSTGARTPGTRPHRRPPRSDAAAAVRPCGAPTCGSLAAWERRTRSSLTSPPADRLLDRRARTEAPAGSRPRRAGARRPRPAAPGSSGRLGSAPSSISSGARARRRSSRRARATDTPSRRRCSPDPRL